MNILKNNIRLIILAMILILVSSGIGVFATYNYLASDIKYTDDKTVADALNELYDKNRNYQVTKIEPSSRGVFNIPEGITTAYIIFLNATSGNQEYLFNANSNVMIGEPTSVLSTWAIDKSLYTALTLYKVELTGSAGTITCTATGVNGNNYGYQIAMFY